MSNVISKLKVIVKNINNRQPISGANVYWAEIPETDKHKRAFCNKFKDSETGLTIDVTNYDGFSLLLGKLGHDTELWFYIHKVVCQGYKEIMIEMKLEEYLKILSVKGCTEKEFTVDLVPDNE